MRKIELLSPAKNITCGIEAIRHGADAVYIGGPVFGARQAANNTIEDIASLCDYAHIFDAKVYVTLNTIIYDEELAEVEQTIWQLHEAGVDALIIQDTALLTMNLPPIALHASTQMHNHTLEKVRSLEAAGFSQVVLPRELSLDEISTIHNGTSLPLEAFVHGALCVSYSGRCYASQYCFGRSANRGNCAQFCRLAFDLIDAEGNTIVHDRHLLSLRDMNRSSVLEAMMDAGISSFKIEGRLKDVDYVKNVTAYYRQKIDEIINRRSDEYERASAGKTTIKGFTPKLERSFNRGFTDYFILNQRDRAISNIHTPKATGEFVGKVANISKESFSLKYATGVDTITAGDGLCFIDKTGRLQGFRVNSVTNDGRIVPLQMENLTIGTNIFRNLDHAFSKALQRPTAVRTIKIDIQLSETKDGYELSISTQNGHNVTLKFNTEKKVASKPQADNIKRILSKLGNTPFEADNIHISTSQDYFIPASALTAWRRQAVDLLLKSMQENHQRDLRRPIHPDSIKVPAKPDYSDNIANRKAASFYRNHGAANISPAFELEQPTGSFPIMTCRYCIRHALGACIKQGKAQMPGKEPLAIRLPDGRRFPLSFDCKKCQMTVWGSSPEQ